ncbi:methyl-CpG-binding domain protein 1-like isoform X2 [Mixophyes fleayi]|uniref:methyl-CpG-binding domain protein 1-like isoform X2 n=1 Tax=Mixophyes fleayi TaxID=3061075 RepID=UPI003F4E418E
MDRKRKGVRFRFLLHSRPLPTAQRETTGQFQASPVTMSEGWKDWPILGLGWKRRTAVRKSGASCGHSDTYYQSPTGKRIRSKSEMAKLLGDSVDLSMFDFKNGTVIPPEKRRTPKKHSLSPKSTGESQAKKQRLSFPLSPTQDQQIVQEDESLVVCCTGCQVWFTGVEFGKSKQTVWYCADCRASRRAFNKQQKLLKNAGCGACVACRLSENCGYCTVCLLRSHNPEFGSSWKCVKRRCVQGGDCGNCQGCSVTEDCEACSVCIKRQQMPSHEVQEKCLKRRCQIKKPEIQSPEKKGFSTKKLNIKWKPLSEQDSSSFTSKHKKKPYFNKMKPKFERRRPQQLAGRRKNRKCGACEACLQKLDCGECDFCQDKPKFGGRNLKRQKCRWRQCLRFAMEKNIPLYLKSTNHPVLLERIKKEASENMDAILRQDEEAQITAKIPVIKLERLEQRNGGYGSTDETNGGWAIDHVDTKVIKQEFIESSIVDHRQEGPLDLHCSVKTEEFITENDDVEEADESTPVIMEIFSLGSYNAANGLDHVLQEFVAELIEIPLPAHWEILPHTGPNLQLVQRSRVSTMAETIIHIQPGLHFYIIVREYTVPSFHELYDKHPSRLTTVDEVVELICDLEAYRPCSALPKQGPRSPNCRVLVYEERCPECCTNPWPSGSDL